MEMISPPEIDGLFIIDSDKYLGEKSNKFDSFKRDEVRDYYDSVFNACNLFENYTTKRYKNNPKESKGKIVESIIDEIVADLKEDL